MAENEGGDSKFMSGFLIGFLVGVLISLGIGGTFVVVRGQREMMAVRDAMMMAEQARQEAEDQRMVAEMERKRALDAVRKFGAAIEKLPPPQAEKDE
jgi:hypothetical protein